MINKVSNIPNSLAYAISNLYEPAGMKITKEPLKEDESVEYGAYRFSLENQIVVFRKAKITPTKLGQFVTIWKRPVANGEIAPLDSMDKIDFVIINVSDDKHFGQFIFNSKILIKKGIMSVMGKGGKRAIRVYPSWVKPLSKTAIATQKWQLEYFFSYTQDKIVDLARIKKLFNLAL